MGKKATFLFFLSVSAFSKGGVKKECEDAFFLLAQKLLCLCDPKIKLEEISSIEIPPEVKKIHRLLGEKGDLSKHVKTLISPEAFKDYLRIYKQEEERVLREGKAKDRLRFCSLLQSRFRGLSEKRRAEKLFYLLRCLTVLTKREGEEAQKIFKAIKDLIESDNLPELLAFISATERYLSLVRVDPVERSVLSNELARSYVRAASYLMQLGRFVEARGAIKKAEELSGRRYERVAQGLLKVVEDRERFLKRFIDLEKGWRQSPQSARQYALIFLSVFRKPEEAFEALEASKSEDFLKLLRLLRKEGGEREAAHYLVEISPSFQEPERTGILLLACQLYEKAAGRKESEQAQKLREELDGHIDPKTALLLNPELAYGGISFLVFTTPPGSYVYLDNALQAVRGSLIRTPCVVEGVAPGRHTVMAAQLGFRDLRFRSRKISAGMILSGRHRPGRSLLLSMAGKNLFLHKKIPVEGVLSGASFLFDGETRPLSRRTGFAVGTWPCTFTVLFPRPVFLTAIRMKLWDGDKRFYKYMLDVSPDGRNFYRVVDRSRLGGSSWQNVLFPKMPVRVILIHGLYNSAGNTKFHVLELEGYEIASPENMQNPIVWR